MTDVVIAAAARTPVAAFNGGLSTLAAHELGTIAIKEALKNQCTTLANTQHQSLIRGKGAFDPHLQRPTW